MSKQKPTAKDLGFEPDDVLRRAYVAWHKGGELDQPSTPDSGWEEHDGMYYVVLRNNLRSILAVYRLRGAGALKRMRRPPKSIEGTA